MARLGGAALLAVVGAVMVAVVGPPAHGLAGCPAPAAVCAVRERVFPVASFDPVGSAVLLEPGLLVTSRHVVADRDWADVFLPDGGAVRAAVVPTVYPGDLILLQTPKPLGTTRLDLAAIEDEEAPVYAVVGEVGVGGRGGARVYPPGEVVLPPAPDRPLARLHHTAPSEPGNGGGALVDARGRLVGVIASGGEEGRNEAIPATRLGTLRELSGPMHYAESRRLGAAYRRCSEALERARLGGPPLTDALAEEVIAACAATSNPQLYDMAGRLLALSGRIDDALALFDAALDQDPNALGALVGRATALHLGLRFKEALPDVRRLLALLPGDAEILALAAQAAAWAGDPELAGRVHALTPLAP